MNVKKLFFAVILSLSMPLSALAISAPYVGSIPSSVDANTYTIRVYVDPGSKVTVVGGPSDLAPVTDGQGADKEEDGEVEVMVGLSQNTSNTFSITAEKNGQMSDSVVIQIKENSTVQSGGGDTTPPSAPILAEIADMTDSTEYMITGTAEPHANIYVYSTTGIVRGTTAADSIGKFQVIVELEENKTNRFNVTAEDEAGNESMAKQAVIRQSVDLPDEEEEEAPEPTLEKSSQIFFNDVNGHWAEDYINELSEKEVVSGKQEGVFDPNGLITRAELTKIAMLAFGYSVNSSVDEHPFSDVPRNSWFAPYVEEAKTQGIVFGYPEGGFHPNDYVNRASAMKIILRAAGFGAVATGNSQGGNFNDVKEGDWYASYVNFAAQNGIVNGYANGNFGPADKITRAAVAKIVIKTLELKEGE